MDEVGSGVCRKVLKRRELRLGSRVHVDGSEQRVQGRGALAQGQPDSRVTAGGIQHPGTAPSIPSGRFQGRVHLCEINRVADTEVFHHDVRQHGRIDRQTVGDGQ